MNENEVWTFLFYASFRFNKGDISSCACYIRKFCFMILNFMNMNVVTVLRVYNT